MEGGGGIEEYMEVGWRDREEYMEVGWRDIERSTWR